MPAGVASEEPAAGGDERAVGFDGEREANSVPQR
jgi:hypothetical protein